MERKWNKLSDSRPNFGAFCDWKITTKKFNSNGSGFYYEQENPRVCGFSDKNGLMVSPPIETYWRKRHGSE